MSKENRKLFQPIILLGVILQCFFILGKSWLLKYSIDQGVLIIGNLILFLVSLASLYFLVSGFLHKNVQVFFRSVYGSLMIKMFVCAAAVVIYALSNRATFNKPALYICMALYFVYSFIEVRMIFRLLKQKKSNNE